MKLMISLFEILTVKSITETFKMSVPGNSLNFCHFPSLLATAVGVLNN